MSIHKRKTIYTVQIKYDKEGKNISVRFLPGMNNATKSDKQDHMNGLLEGFRLGLNVLFAEIPMLRPATEQEVDEHVYIFKDEVADNQLYKNRKVLRGELIEMFDSTLHELFPDIYYIDASLEHQQETVTAMSKEEAAEYTKKIAEVAAAVRAETDPVN